MSLPSLSPFLLVSVLDVAGGAGRGGGGNRGFPAITQSRGARWTWRMREGGPQARRFPAFCHTCTQPRPEPIVAARGRLAPVAVCVSTATGRPGGGARLCGNAIEGAGPVPGPKGIREPERLPHSRGAG